VGPIVGLIVGAIVGAIVGPIVGAIVGPIVGAIVGPIVGAIVGPIVGAIVGLRRTFPPEDVGDGGDGGDVRILIILPFASIGFPIESQRADRHGILPGLGVDMTAEASR
jgi:hypothetical protein